jgi:hypothetical protein
MLNILKSKEFWIMVALFVATLFVMLQDPLKLNTDGLEGTSAWGALYFIPTIIAWYFLFVKPTING